MRLQIIAAQRDPGRADLRIAAQPYPVARICAWPPSLILSRGSAHRRPRVQRGCRPFLTAPALPCPDHFYVVAGFCCDVRHVARFLSVAVVT
jgi:hypothetical protein